MNGQRKSNGRVERSGKIKRQKLEGNVGESGKLIKGRRVKNRWMMWHNKRVVTLNSMFQLLDIYIYIDIDSLHLMTTCLSMNYQSPPPPPTPHTYIYIPELNKGLCSQ